MVTKNAGMGVLVLSALAVLAGCADTGSGRCDGDEVSV